jgi:hypothetical protein
MVYSHEAMRREHAAILRDAQHVWIDPDRVQAVARVMREEMQKTRDRKATFRNSPLDALEANDLDTLQFYLAHTSQVFLIWRRNEAGEAQAWDIEVDGKSYVGGPGIDAAHMRALREGRDLRDPGYLASMTLDEIQAIYRDERTGEATLQMLPQRLAKFNEIGRVLLERYDGHVANLLKQTEGYLFRDDDRGLIQQLCLHFPTAYFDWPFCKLGFLFGKYLYARHKSGAAATEEFMTLSAIHDPHHFEISADYYIPLFFIRTGIFRISDEFGRLLAEQRLLERDGRIEREYRAGTVTVGRMIAEETGFSLDEVGYECWQQGYLRCRVCRVGVSDEELPCAYRDLSIGYQSEHHLMQMRWPLVLTTSY